MKDILQPLINEFMPFAQKRMGFEKPPRVFLRDDPQNAQDPLGKTAYYDPEQMSVTLYIHGRHPKDVMRSLSHELVHHMQNCNGQFEDTGDMGEGYAQSDPHLREMEREAYEMGNLCLRDWTDTRNSTIYNVSLQEGAKKKMSTKDWKNNELRTLLSEKWGFSFNLLNESQDEVVEEAAEDETLNEEEEELDEGGAANRMGDPRVRRQDPDRLREEEEVFAPNHYCVHHGGVQRNGSVELAEAVAHNYNEELGRVTHYDMKFADGTVMENVAFEDIQVTNASLAEMHGSHPAKSDHKDKRDEELDEEAKKMVKCGDKGMVPDYACDGKGEDDLKSDSGEKEEKEGGKQEKSEKDLSKVPPQLRKHVKSKMDERNYLDTMGGAEMQLTDKQKEQLGYLLAKRGEKLSLDPVKRKRQINYYIKMLDNRAKEKLDQTPAYMDKDDNKPAIRMMDEQRIRQIIKKLVKEAMAKKAK